MSKPDPTDPGDPGPKSLLRGLGVAEKAKVVMGAAAESAAVLKGRAGTALSSLSEQATKRAQEALGAGLDQLTGAAADLNVALPIIRLAGYSLHGVTLSASLTPNIVAAFRVEAVVTDEQAAAIETEHADNVLAVMIIRTLRRASKLQERISIGALKPKELSISIGLAPSVSLRFGDGSPHEG